MPSILEELLSEVPKAVDAVISALPADFPVELANSIPGGITRRLRILELGEQADHAFLRKTWSTT